MADDDPPIQPLVVPTTAIPNPLQPAAVPAGQIPSLVPGGGRPYQPMDLGRQIATSVAGSSIADQMVQDFVRKQNFTPTTRSDPIAPLIEEYRKTTAMRPVEQSFRGESFNTAFRGQAGELDPQVVGVPDALRQAERGFLSAWNESFFGTAMNRLMSYGTLYKAAQETTDPNYDEFNDPQIKAAGLDNQMHLFIGGGSAQRTRLIIQYYQKRQQETAWLDRASGIAGWAGGTGALAASLAGDPTNFIPGSLGIKGLSLTMRGTAGLLTGPELPLLYGRKAVYGSIADGLRFASINAAAMIAERALVHSMDPTLPGEMTTDIILPSVIAGSLGLYTGIATRRVARTLAEETRQNDFLVPLTLSGQRYGAPNQRGGIIRETGEHSGDFPPGSLATDYGNIRRAEMKADPYVASTSQRDEAAGAWRAVKPDEVFPPGQKFRMNQTTGVSEIFVPAPAKAAGRIDHELPADASGSRELVLNGQSRSAAEFEVGHTFTTPGGQTWRVNNVEGTKRFVLWDQKAPAAKPRAVTTQKDIDNLDPRGERDIFIDGKPVPAHQHTAGTRLIDDKGIEWELRENKLEGDVPKIWRVISTNEAKKAPTRLTDMEFTPGELEAAVPTRAEFDAMATRGTLRKHPGGTDPRRPTRSEMAALEAGETRSENWLSYGRLYGYSEDDIAHFYMSRQDIFAGPEEAYQAYVASLLESKVPVGGGATPSLGSVGAALNPASQAYRRDVLLDQGRMAPSGLGIENWGLTPVARLFRGESVAAMDTTTKLVSTSGLQTKGNQLGIAQVGQPVEVLIQVNWNRPMVQVQRATQDAWTDYRRALANASQPAPPSVAGRSDTARVASQVGAAISDFVHTGEKGLSLAQFKERVGQALRQGDADTLGDSASSYVTRAAAEHRKLYNLTRERSLELGLFDEAHKEAIYAAQSELRALKKEANQIKITAQKEKWSPTQMREAEEALLVRTEDAQFRFRQAENKLEELRANGPQLNGTAPSYAPRIYRVDKLMDDEEKFVTTISDWLQSRHAQNGGQLAQPEAARLAKEIHTLLSKQTPIYERGDQAALFKGVANPASVQARSLNIPDALIADFLEHDAEVLMRHHIKQMGTAIEMKEKFGSLDLADEIAEIEQEYRRQIIAANKGATEPTERAKELTAMMKGAIADVQALRDRLYGTYGASPDPQRWQSRTVRMAKQFSNLTLMGMSGITALGDLVRPLVTEGFDAFHGYGFRSLMSDQRALILRLNREELELAGNGMELMLNTRALSFADNGDIFAGRSSIERGMNQANSWMFVANGLNHVNQMDKEWASLIIGGRVNKVFLDLATTRGAVDASQLNPRFATLSDTELKAAITKAEQEVAALGSQRQIGTRIQRAQALRQEIVEHEAELAARGAQQSTGTLSPKDLARFAAVGIDEAMARRIGLQLKIHKHSFGTGDNPLIIANSEAWGDKAAQQAYRGAMNQMTNRTVPTPGVGDTPLLMSTELGGLLTQYKSFAFGAMNRVLLSGLQEDGMKFWYGAGMMVASAALLNEVRSQLFYGKSTTDKPAPAIIADAVDRSSILGWFGDVDRAVTMLSGNSVGIKPMVGAASPVQPRFSQVAGAVGGPSAGQAVRLLNVANDALSGHPTAQTYRDWRNVIVGQNLPYADPVMDMLFEKDGLLPSVLGTNKQDRRNPAGFR